MTISPWGRAIFGCDFIARPRRSAAATPSSSLFVSLENRLGQMVTLFLAGPLALPRGDECRASLPLPLEQLDLHAARVVGKRPPPGCPAPPRSWCEART